MLLSCAKCKFEVASEDANASKSFYVKHRNKIPVNRSDWCSYCAPCIKIQKREYWAKNKERVSKQHREARLANIEEYLKKEAAARLAKHTNPDKLKRYRAVVSLDERAFYVHKRCVMWKASAKKRGLVFDLSTEWLLDLLDRQGGVCFYSGRSLFLEPNKADTISLDRVDPAKGYVKGNVVLCSTVVNLCKLDQSVEDFKKMVGDLSDRSSKWEEKLKEFV